VSRCVTLLASAFVVREATHLRQFRPILRQRGRKQMTIDHLKNSWRPATAAPADPTGEP
jgi:hypothetical protein